MTRLRLPIITLLCLAAFSCDKVKSLVNKARSTVDSQAAKKSGAVAAEEGLEKLVDRTPEGVVFRKDLPFPSKLQVKITRKEELSGRFSRKSELESQVMALKGTLTTVTQQDRSGDKVSYTLVESIFAEPVSENADAAKKPAAKTAADAEKPAGKPTAPPSKPYQFVKSGTAWRSADGTDFRSVSLAQTISPVFDQLLVESTLAPRVLWFGKKRLKVGDTLTVSDKFLPMLITGDAKGSLKLTLTGFDSVSGHPCGVFDVTGDYSRKQFPAFDGTLTNEEVTIESGKLWLSLLYPLILKEETLIIQTISNGGRGGLATRGQGSVKVSVIREWKKTGN